MQLADDERELLLAEVAGALDQVRSPERRAAYGELLAAVDRGEIPDDLHEVLQVVLEVGLESGRIRRLHTAHGEMAARRLYSRTPGGRALREATDTVNQALRALAGRRIEELSITPQGPGAFLLSLATDDGNLLLRIDRQGVRLQSVEVG